MAATQLRAVPGSSQRRRFLFFTGIAMALIAFLLIFALGSVFVNGLRPATGSVTVVVAARDIQAREVIAADAVTTTGFQAQYVPAGSFAKVSQVTNQAAAVPILKGQPITSNVVSASPDELITGQQSYLPIPPGFVARAIPTSEQQGVAGYVAAGDFVNVVATIDTTLLQPGSQGRTVTKTIFENLHVIRVGPIVPQAGGKQGAGQGVSSSLVVTMTACDAEVLDWFIGTGARLTYVLLSYKDYVPAPTQPNPGCPSSTAPGAGVGPQQIEQRYKFLET